MIKQLRDWMIGTCMWPLFNLICGLNGLFRGCYERDSPNRPSLPYQVTKESTLKTESLNTLKFKPLKNAKKPAIFFMTFFHFDIPLRRKI